MNSHPPIQATGLTLFRGPNYVLDGLDWTVPQGTATGLLGRNGAGKSSLMHVALGLLTDVEGECRTLGQASHRLDDQALAKVGFVDQHYELLDWLKVEEQVRYVSLMRPTWDRDLEQKLLGAFELAALSNTSVESLSAGARQRLSVLLALCHRPELILLDEPVSAQDPIFRTVVLDEIRARVIDDGATVVLSSHVLRDIEAVVDRIAVLNAGRIAANEELDVLKEKHQLWVVVGGSVSVSAVRSLPYVLHVEEVGGALQMYVRAGESERRAFADQHQCLVEVRGLSLEKLFPLLLNPQEPTTHAPAVIS